MKLSLKICVVCCLCMAIVIGQAHWGIAAEQGTITGVKLAPDMSGIAIQHDGTIGSCSSFVMQNPFRLVLDVNQAQLATIPGKIPVQGARIDEIRLGYADSRARIVVDFGKNPVPPFKIERGIREIRLNWGRGLALGGDKPGKLEKPKENKHSSAKNASLTDPRKKSEGVVVVKSARVDKNRVLLELTQNRNPGKTFVLAVEMDAQDLNVRGATLRDDKGTVKRFQLATVRDGIAGVHVETVTPWDKMGKQAEQSDRSHAAKAKFKWGLKAAQDADRTLSGPTKKGALQMEGFVLKPRAQQGG